MTASNSAFSSSYISEAFSELLSKGRPQKFDPNKVGYVCHTSTIPLATTVDEQYVLKDYKNCEDVSHSVKYIDGPEAELISYRCCKVHCMYIGAHGKSDAEILRSNCPCGKIVRSEILSDGSDVEVSLQPLCFLQVLKELRYNFGYTDKSQCETDDECCHNKPWEQPIATTRPRIDFEEVMFCQNSQSILDSGYSAPLRRIVGFSGWESVNRPEQLSDVLGCLYWYRTFATSKTLKLLNSSTNFKALKQCVAQCLHTLNGLLCKKFLLFPCEMEGYVKLAKNTAYLFEALLADYLHPVDEETIAGPETSIFLRMKSSFKAVKEAFASEDYGTRKSCIDLISSPEQRDAAARFWHPCAKRLRRRVSDLDDSDYTKSISWISTMSGFSQTRNLGYLPNWVAVQRREAFRNTIGRPTQQIPKEELKLVRALILKRLKDSDIEPYLLSPSKKTEDRFKEIINSIALPLKVSASENSTVAEGGKVEDARQLISDGIKFSWVIPVRDFATGEQVSRLEYRRSLRSDQPAYEGYLFWTAFQIVLNFFSKRIPRYKKFYCELKGSTEWEDHLFRMKIVHISEPGKERNLTKTSSLVAWVLTVCSKVSQAGLAFSQDHRSGLVLSAQDWMHQRRVSSESYESYFIYDEKTRLRKADVTNGYQDWTESTDFIPRQIGATALQAWLQYLDFPRFYGDMVIHLVMMNYQVVETSRSDWIQGIQETDFYVGRVSEGFMMSMPLTKTILHLMHDVNIGLAHAILKDTLGVTVPSAKVVFDRYDPNKHGAPKRRDQLSVHKSDT